MQHRKTKTYLGTLVDSCIYVSIEFSKTFLREVLLLLGQILNLCINLLLHIFFSPGHYEQTSAYKAPTIDDVQNDSINGCFTNHDTASNDDSMSHSSTPTTPTTRNRLRQALELTLKKRSTVTLSPLSTINTSQPSSQHTSPATSPKLQPAPSSSSSPLLQGNFQLQQHELQNQSNLLPQSFIENNRFSKRRVIWKIFVRIVKCFWLVPSLFFRRSTSKTSLSFNDHWTLAQKKTTGLGEDILHAVLLFMDNVGKCMRLAVRCKFFTAAKLFYTSFALFKPSQFLSKEGIDQRSMREVIIEDGYPYKRYRVETRDNYYLRLERIPKPNSRVAIYCQHGILDSGFCWIANGPEGSIAYRCFDTLNCDVFMGNFRGFGPSLTMKSATDRKNLKQEQAETSSDGNHQQQHQKQDYWDYSMNELAFYDCRAFIEKIAQLKRAELGDDNFDIIVVAHSMGAGSTLAYLVHSKLAKFDHRVKKVILLSPAGNHMKLSRLLMTLSRIAEPIWDYFPLNLLRYVGMTTKTTKIIAAKIVQDFNNHPATKSLLAAMMSQTLFGGETKKNPFQYIHNLVYHTLNGTSVKVIKHFVQLNRSSKFQAFDYGPKKNFEMYNSETPLCFLDHYDKIDIPIHIVYGTDDRVIPAECILQHYDALHKVHPELVYLKRFDNVGHLDVVYGNDENVIQYVLQSIQN